MDRSPRKRTRTDRCQDEELEPGSVLGRFRIIRHLGRGGMGAVYEAEDTRHEQRVALKVVASLSASGRARLLSEARALARVKHPNVVLLHDVGLVDDRVFVALELVRGTTLARWIAEEKRDWGEVLVHFVAAGRGLAEAHQAGLAHGDFKPSNVLVATDGRVLVSDFGLAQSMESETTVTGRSSLSTEKRQRVVGTPAYMAPELFRGSMKGAATDQFAFCVALYEAFWGEHPYGGGSWESVARRITEGRMKSPPRDGVPRHIRRAVLRGLSARPRQRWRSMTELLDKLTSPPPRGLPRSALALGGVALAGTLTFTLVNEDDPCGGEANPMTGTWDDEARVRVSAAVIDSGQATPQSWKGIETAIDDWTTTWHATRHAVCEATLQAPEDEQTRGDQLACLDRASVSLTALTITLEQADETAGSPNAGVAGLPAPSDCLTASVSLPSLEDPQARALLMDYERGAALRRIGSLGRADAVAKDVAERAERVNDCETATRSKILLGQLQRERGYIDEGLEQLRAATDAAAECGRNDLLAEATIQVADTIARRGVEVEAARTWLARARGIGLELPRDSAKRRLFNARLLMIQARVDMLAGDHDAAERNLAEAKAHVLAKGDAAVVSREAGPRASILELEGQVLLRRGRFPTAGLAFQEALELRGKIMRDDDPRLASAVVGLAQVAMMSGDSTTAATHLHRALDLLEKGYGPGHPRTAVVLNNLAAVEADRGELASARDYVLKAIESSKAAPSRRPEDLITMRVNAATLASKIGEHETAVREATEALAAAEAELGPDSRAVGLALRVLTSNRYASGDAVGSEAAGWRAVEVLEKRGEAVLLAETRALLGEIVAREPGREAEVLELLKPVRSACSEENTAISRVACARAAFFTAVSMPSSSPEDAIDEFVAEARELIGDDPRPQEFQAFHDRLSAWPATTSAGRVGVGAEP